MDRTILHADMDAFYASVEQRDDPALRGKPVAVGGKPPRGVVAAASYEARRYGVCSAQPMAHAIRDCPQLIVLRPRISYYSEISREIKAIFRSYSPLVEPLSLDEAFVDLTGTERLHGPASTVARQIKDRVRDQLQLVVSVGVGPSKFIAKLASDLGKPDGLLLVEPQDVRQFLDPLGVNRLWGVGRVMQQKLHGLGISTIGQLARLSQDFLTQKFGSHGEHLWCLANGIDPREVVTGGIPKSIGHEDTFAEDLRDEQRLREIINGQADQVARRLRKQQLVARVVVLKVKTQDFKTRTRRKTLPRPTSDGSTLGEQACELLARVLPTIGPIRLTGVSATQLESAAAPRQLSLDEPTHQRTDRLGEAIDKIADRFGGDAISRGQVAGRGKRLRDNNA